MEAMKAGAMVKAERLRQNLSLDDMSRKTYIRKTYLEAIEEGEYDKIPDLVYARGFIKRCGRVLGMDEEALAMAFDRDTGTPSVPVPYDVSPRRIRRRRNGENHNIEVLTSGGSRIRDKRHFGRVEWFIIFILLLSVAAFWIWLFWL